MSWMTDKYWTTKEGVKLYPRDMDDGHLNNTIRMLERAAPNLKLGAELDLLAGMSFLQGEMAQYCLEQDAWGLAMMGDIDFLESNVHIYSLLVKERDKRAGAVERLLAELKTKYGRELKS